MKIEQKTITQHCIKSHFFNEVINLPKEVKITNIFFELGVSIKRLSQPVPDLLKKAGVTRVRKFDPSVEVDGKLTGTRERMKKDIKFICKHLDLSQKTVRVKRMKVVVGNNEGIFCRTQKSLHGEDGKSNKITVLGLVKWEGSEVEIAKACSTNPFKCKLDTQIVRTVICEEE